MGLQLRGSLIGMDTEENWHEKGNVSVGEVHGPKVRGASANSPTENFPFTYHFSSVSIPISNSLN